MVVSPPVLGMHIMILMRGTFKQQAAMEDMEQDLDLAEINQVS